jgi:hypothetical protein
LNRFSWIPTPATKPIASVPSGTKDGKKEAKSDRGEVRSGQDSVKAETGGKSGSENVGIERDKIPSAVSESTTVLPESSAVPVKSDSDNRHDADSCPDNMSNRTVVKIEATNSMYTPENESINPSSEAVDIKSDPSIKEEPAGATESTEQSMEVSSISGGNATVKSEPSDGLMATKSEPQPGISIINDPVNKLDIETSAIDLTKENASVQVLRENSSVIIVLDEEPSQPDEFQEMGNSTSPARSEGSNPIPMEVDSNQKPPIPSDNPDESAMKSPVPTESNYFVADATIESASESGTPRVTESRESSLANAPEVNCANRESTEPIVAPVSSPIVSKEDASKSDKSRKESKNKSEKSSRTKSAHELVELIVKVLKSADSIPMDA